MRCPTSGCSPADDEERLRNSWVDVLGPQRLCLPTVPNVRRVQRGVRLCNDGATPVRTSVPAGGEPFSETLDATWVCLIISSAHAIMQTSLNIAAQIALQFRRKSKR
jgi:hypothetical protein